MAKMRETYSSDYSPKMKPPVVSPGPVGDHVSESSQSDFMVRNIPVCKKHDMSVFINIMVIPTFLQQYSDLDTQILDEQIKSIMTVSTQLFRVACTAILG